MSLPAEIEELITNPARIAGFAFSTCHSEVVVALSVGTGVAVGMIDRTKKVAGILHTLLPDSGTDPMRRRVRPRLFVDSGIEHLLDEMKKRGARSERIETYLVGGALVLGATNELKIGQRNCDAAKETLEKLGLKPSIELTQDYANRSLFLPVGDQSPRVTVTGKEDRTVLCND